MRGRAGDVTCSLLCIGIAAKVARQIDCCPTNRASWDSIRSVQPQLVMGRPVLSDCSKFMQPDAGRF